MGKIHKVICAFTLMSVFALGGYGQKYASLKFELIGKKIDTLRVATRDSNNNLVLLYGKSSDKTNWSFSVPLDIWNRLDRIVLGKADEKQKIRKYEYVKFLYGASKNKEQTLAYTLEDVPCYVPDWKDAVIKAKYINSDTVFVEEDNVQLIYHNYMTEPLLSSGMEAWAKCPQFSQFTELGDSDLYEHQLSEYQNLAKEYPDSRLLISRLNENITKYHSLEDVESVFNLFSDENKRSFFGNQIRKYLSLSDWTKLGNVSLRNSQSHQMEKVVRDSTVFTLVSFTASWCVYCKEEVSILKQIYSELIDQPFDMVYIDVDDKQAVQTFINQAVRDSISWRILIAYPRHKELVKIYARNGIPINILVCPGGKTEYIDVRKAETMNKLISIVKNRNLN